MNKELFIKTVEDIKALYKEQEILNDALHTIDPEFGGGYIYNKPISILENLLKELVNDQYGNISYYFWELDFGEKYYDGCITGPNGEIIKLATPEDLYNLIKEENE